MRHGNKSSNPIVTFGNKSIGPRNAYGKKLSSSNKKPTFLDHVMDQQRSPLERH